MAEIRKHNPKITNAIDAALLKAMGEEPRPVTPGAERESQRTSQADPTTLSVHWAGGAGGFEAFSVPPVDPLTSSDSEGR